ncbi:MAG: T9SS type A sorting domain-containing protein, partial [Bacteroidia bacterium]|nr:T9SS type A sorting domain-containing protein [Bacteroidia bacterium]
IQAATVTNNNPTLGLTARGGNGGNAGTYTFIFFTFNGGRGGGGGGGRIYIQGNYTGPALTAATNCPGGATGASGGNAGQPGANGTVRIDGVCTPASSVYQWVGGGAPNVNAWNQNNNWNPATVPPAGADVIIPETTHQPIITTSTPLLGSLTVNNKALVRIHAGGVLNVNGVTNGGTIRMAGGFMNAVNVCNNELIEVNDPTNYMTVTGYLKNNGVIQTNNLDPGPDVRMMDSDATSANNSRYEGTGSNIGVDYYIINTPAVNIQTVLEANLSCRSLIVQGNLVATNRTVTLKKDYNVQSGTVTYTGSTFVLDGDGSATVLHGGNPQTLSAAAIQTFNNLFVQKTGGHALLTNTFRVSNTLRFACQNAAYVEAGSHELHLTNNAPGSLERIPDFADPMAGHVVGKLRRQMNTVLGVFEFPLGINNSVAAALRYQRAQMDVKALTPGFMASVVGEFLAVGNPTGAFSFNESSALPVSGVDNPVPYELFITGPGYWNLSPNTDPTTINYDLSIWPNGFTSPVSPYWTFARRRSYPPAYPWGLRGTKSATAWPWVRRTSLNSFSDVAPIQSPIPFPVEASPLTAQALDNEIRLIWQTFSETSNKGFEIERGTDGTNFAKIGFVEGAGTSRETKNYAYDDADVRRGVVYYYRYKQLDFDGRSAYSNVAQAVLPEVKGEEALTALTVYPNPFKNSVTFRYVLRRPASMTLEIYDMTGKLVAAPMKNVSTKTSGEKTVDLSALSPGMYIYRVRAGGDTFSGKIVRE